MSDTVFWTYLDRLAGGCEPLVAETGEMVRLARTGLRVHKGTEDYIRVRGIDRWLGGVHLCGTEAQWRWDEGRLWKCI
jgi:hypothetical protein